MRFIITNTYFKVKNAIDFSSLPVLLILCKNNMLDIYTSLLSSCLLTYYPTRHATKRPLNAPQRICSVFRIFTILNGGDHKTVNNVNCLFLVHLKSILSTLLRLNLKTVHIEVQLGLAKIWKLGRNFLWLSNTY